MKCVLSDLSDEEFRDYKQRVLDGCLDPLASETYLEAYFKRKKKEKDEEGGVVK